MWSDLTLTDLILLPVSSVVRGVELLSWVRAGEGGHVLMADQTSVASRHIASRPPQA